MKPQIGTGLGLQNVTINVPAAEPFSQYPITVAGNFIEYLSGTSNATLLVQLSSGQKFKLAPGKWYQLDNSTESFNISGFAAGDVLDFNVGFAHTSTPPSPINIPPTPYQSEPILVGVTLTPIGISPEIDYKYAVLTMLGYDPGATIELETLDEFGYLLSSVPIYNTDGSPFTTTRAVTAIPPGPFGTNYYTIVVPMMGAKQLKLTAGGAGGGFTVAGSFTNNWN